LKKLYEEIDQAPPANAANPRAVAEKVALAPKGGEAREAAQARDHPAVATFHSRTLLNREGSAKETWHVEFDLSESGLEYMVGDSFGIFPTNDMALVRTVCAVTGADPEKKIRGRSLREILLHDVSLSPAPDSLF